MWAGLVMALDALADCLLAWVLEACGFVSNVDGRSATPDQRTGLS